MSGVRRILASLSVLLLVLACSGERGSDAARTAGDQPDDSAATRTDTATIAAVDTAAAPASPAAPPSKPPAPKPAAPKAPAPKPAPAPAATPPETTAVRPAAPETTQTAAVPATQAGAPLRDEYHQAPRDTVTAVVYDGWKQYNLNCARCHGEDVLGTTIAPHLIVSVRPGGLVDTKEAYIKTVCEGRPEKGMPAWCPLGLGIDKIDATYQYVKGRSDGKIGPGRPARRE